MKRLVFCFDGSWNRIDAAHPTNVLFTAQSVLPQTRDGISQVIYYDEGVGTGDNDKFRGGLFGQGLVKNLSDAYRFLIFNHTPGDEIYVFGFSRGAFTARSFAGLIGTCGILQRPSAGRSNEAVELYKKRDDTDAFRQKLLEFRRDVAPHISVSDAEDQWRAANVPDYQLGQSPLLKITYLGVWDTVGALGVPDYIWNADGFNKDHRFHDTNLSPMVKSARHAVAIDESKADFKPTLWENLEELNTGRGKDPKAEDAPYQQKWFPGVHGGVGGGGPRRGLSDQALEWIWDGAGNAGLVLDSSKGSPIYGLSPSHLEYLENSQEDGGFSIIGTLMKYMPKTVRQPGPQALHEVSVSAQRRWHEKEEKLPEKSRYRPKPLEHVQADLDGLDVVALGMGEDGIELAPDNFTAHIVEPGDTLSGLAKRYLGDAKRWPEIASANRYKITNPDLIYVGQALRIPLAASGSEPTV
ncbi:DUF2235 domain-containing protein [Devosia sp. MC521]|uniref:phospholipase effector Tle1 domain-containing protein n=1 Tax=Devosia sp. MC521 TaxID=2759954 RepID=UPI0015F86579|nr:DUF2235 domain-containing protein [Devosia sp. MC521]MBJ6988957.1 DUF2235 domain-containing protein [Devosia sp. MC521]QMW64389.1 DUF2235 domain-containing protein [Devosia sp. MC521]